MGNWALKNIGAHYAYAKGFNGSGVSITIFDAKVFPHFKYADKLTSLDKEQPYDTYTDDDGNELFEDHSTMIAGMAAANRDGRTMHGVAYKADIISAKFLGNKKNYFQHFINSNSRIMNNSWGPYPDVETDAQGNKIILDNGNPKYKIETVEDAISDYPKERLENILLFSKFYIPRRLEDEHIWLPAALLKATRAEKLVIFAGGNSNSYNVPRGESVLPYLIPEMVGKFLVVVATTEEDKLASWSTRCGYTASYCLAAPGEQVYGPSAKLIPDLPIDHNNPNVTPTYKAENGTSYAAPIVGGAAAILMQRFPYMTASQITTILLSTATDLGEKGIDDKYGWGKVNLRSAIEGPKMFITADDIPKEFYIPGSYTETQFVANIAGIGATIENNTANQRICGIWECSYDKWTNDITGHGGLTKTGIGTLELSGNSTYAGPTLIHQGTLVVNGSVVSEVSVEKSGTLSGIGRVGQLRVRDGGVVAPGNSIGTLQVDGDITFESGAKYAVEVSQSGKSDEIVSQGAAKLAGGIAVSLENKNHLLSKNDLLTILGKQYRILSAVKGIEGQFDTMAPNLENSLPDYLFLGMHLNYQPDHVILDIKRNDTTFDSVAKTANEHAVAKAAEKLAPGNPIYESLFSVRTTDEARHAFNELSGQLHADIGAALTNESRYLRETLNSRLRQASGLATAAGIKTDTNGAWAQLVSGWDRASSHFDVPGYRASTYGVLLGVDGEPRDNTRIGLATGYTRTSINGGYQGKAKSHNYQLAAYGQQQFNALALRAGAGYTWHRLDTERSVNYGAQSDHNTAKYDARTQQLFAEMSYGIQQGKLNLEPFGHFAYVNFKRDSLHEDGGAAALRGDTQNTSATLSTLGLRANREWQINENATLGLQGELGWQHQYRSLAREATLRFSSTETPFVINSVSAAGDSAVIKTGITSRIKQSTLLSLGYSGLLSPRHQDNSINLGFTQHF